MSIVAIATPFLIYYVLHPSIECYINGVYGVRYSNGLGPIIDIPRFILNY